MNQSDEHNLYVELMFGKEIHECRLAANYRVFFRKFKQDILLEFGYFEMKTLPDRMIDKDVILPCFTIRDRCGNRYGSLEYDNLLKETIAEWARTGRSFLNE